MRELRSHSRLRSPPPLSPHTAAAAKSRPADARTWKDERVRPAFILFPCWNYLLSARTHKWPGVTPKSNPGGEGIAVAGTGLRLASPSRSAVPTSPAPTGPGKFAQEPLGEPRSAVPAAREGNLGTTHPHLSSRRRAGGELQVRRKCLSLRSRSRGPPWSWCSLKRR